MGRLASPLVIQENGPLPLVFSVPHSGRDYPRWLVDSARRGRGALALLEDPLVDHLVRPALTLGQGAVIARAPRAAIDCNRGEDEIDPMVVRGTAPQALSARARGGLGIVPGRTRRHGPLWRTPITPAELEGRLNDAHRPYHQGLRALVARCAERFGCALLIDCHSMPPLGDGAPSLVAGDQFGRSAAGWIAELIVEAGRQAGLAARVNDPFAGGYVLDLHGRPHEGVHAVQIELDRALYCDSSLLAAGGGFVATSRFLQGLAARLGRALLDRQHLLAAE